MSVSLVGSARDVAPDVLDPVPTHPPTVDRHQRCSPSPDFEGVGGGRGGPRPVSEVRVGEGPRGKGRGGTGAEWCGEVVHSGVEEREVETDRDWAGRMEEGRGPLEHVLGSRVAENASSAWRAGRGTTRRLPEPLGRNYLSSRKYLSYRYTFTHGGCRTFVRPETNEDKLVCVKYLRPQKKVLSLLPRRELNV